MDKSLKKRNEEIIDKFIDGYTTLTLAKEYNLSREHINKIIREGRIYDRWQK